MKGPMLICFFFERVNTDDYLCILAMFTMSRKDVKHVNWPGLEVLSLLVCKCETRRESAVKLWFPDDIGPSN